MITYYKFRGKQYKTGEWLVGDLIHFRHDVMILPLDADWFDFVPRKNNPLRLPSDRFVIDKSTIGQFTGLHDKHGYEIYEGDIVRHDENSKCYSIIYEEPMFRFAPNDDCFAFLNHPELLEVIGNIHDNPEMLEKGGKQ